jgi:hypothetical protein
LGGLHLGCSTRTLESRAPLLLGPLLQPPAPKGRFWGSCTKTPPCAKSHQVVDTLCGIAGARSTALPRKRALVGWCPYGSFPHRPRACSARCQETSQCACATLSRAASDTAEGCYLPEGGHWRWAVCLHVREATEERQQVGRSHCRGALHHRRARSACHLSGPPRARRMPPFTPRCVRGRPLERRGAARKREDEGAHQRRPRQLGNEGWEGLPWREPAQDNHTSAGARGPCGSGRAYEPDRRCPASPLQIECRAELPPILSGARDLRTPLQRNRLGRSVRLARSAQLERDGS